MPTKVSTPGATPLDKLRAFTKAVLGVRKEDIMEADKKWKQKRKAKRKRLNPAHR